MCTVRMVGMTGDEGDRSVHCPYGWYVHMVGMTGDEGGRSVHCPHGWYDW